jgi:hypothetical protein
MTTIDSVSGSSRNCLTAIAVSVSGDLLADETNKHNKSRDARATNQFWVEPTHVVVPQRGRSKTNIALLR